MRRVFFSIVMVGLILGMSSCSALEGETLYSQPQPTSSNTEQPPPEGQTPAPDSQSLADDSADEIELADDESPAPEAFTLVVPHPSQGNLQAVLAGHAEQASEMGRYPFVEFTAEWCPPCQAIEANLGDPMMINALRGVYLIRLDIDEWESQITRSGFLVPGIPLFYELDAKGASTGRAISGSAWGADVPQNMAPPLSAYFQANQSGNN
ncbi:MAG: thioredoxin family protein [Anaerolineales bacterium]|jgi:thiol-disulfide isomerase/thioredoxin